MSNFVINKFFLKPLGWYLCFSLSFAMTVGSSSLIRAESAKTAPVALKNLIEQIEGAANQQDLKKLMIFYSPDFSNSDGLNYESFQKGLTNFWQQYKNIKYSTTLQSWEQKDSQFVAETVTKVEGTGEYLGRQTNLNARIVSRQYFKDQKLVYQEIVEESTEVKLGENPPDVAVNLPRNVRVGQTFDFDVVVQEPLGDDVLAGAALNEKIDSATYLNPGTLKLDLLSSGGLFKRAKAPDNPESQWFSAIIVRGDGVTLVTQRVKVEK